LNAYIVKYHSTRCFLRLVLHQVCCYHATWQRTAEEEVVAII